MPTQPAVRPTASALAPRIDAVLPQTQCTKCGFDGCRPYAEAIAEGTSAHNRCVPGGAAGIERLSALLGCAVLALDPQCGSESPRRLARIDPRACIGCTKCIAACPVDAIIGAPKRMHTVIDARCTGCDLCVAPCPVDCIEMIAPDVPSPWTDADAMRARGHYDARRARIEREHEDAVIDEKRAVIESAMRRARALLERDAQRR